MKKKLLLRPIVVLLLLEGLLVGANYIPGTWLMGWDNVMPEFNFKQAFMTNFFGVWQEHRGLGLYDGMGHAANLVHTLFLWLLSLTLPTNLLRYTFTFLMHFLGGVGAYVLLKKLTGKWAAITGALFYQYNLATIQMFYTPLEAFSMHFAALPWLAWSLITYLQEGSRKRFLIFLLVSFLSTPQFFIPTLLLPVAILLTSLSIAARSTIKRIGMAACGFLLINAFWLLPYLYGLPNNAPIIQAAKINQMSSEEVFARNQAFGDLGSVLRLRGFPLDFEDTDAAGATTLLMAPWRMFLAYPMVAAGSWVVVGITLLGLVVLKKNSFWFILTFLAGLLFLASDTPVLGEFTTILQDHIPFFAEAFRFPFTKFSLLFAFSSTVLFTIGLARIAKARIITIIVIGLIVILALPALRGNFFSDRLRITLPNDYLRVFAFMKNKPLGRVAYLPQQQYWSWKYYQWGYRGSGFLWYGLPQPILDRAFDPWSGYNENYYWELSWSIYSKDVVAFNAVLSKYDVRYLLLDEHITSPSHNRALFTEEIKAMLAALPEVKEVAHFGNLTIYERLGDDTKDFIRIKKNLPTVSPSYNWTDNDVAYRELGDYISLRSNEGMHQSVRPEVTNNEATFIYPFRSLFTKRSVDEREFTVEENEERFIFRSRALTTLPVFSEESDVKQEKNNEKQSVEDSNIGIDVQNGIHSDFLSNNTATTNDTIPSDTLAVKKPYSLGESNRKTVGNTNTDPNQAADKLVSRPDTTRNKDFLSRLDITTSVPEGETVVNVTILKADALVYDSTRSADLAAENVKPCGVLRNGTATAQNIDQYLQFTSRNQRGCLSFGVSNLPHRDGYLIAVENHHVSGRPLLFSLINQTAKHVELETYLEKETSYFILPPLATDGLGYTVYLSNDAIGKQETVNDIKSIKFYRIPYQELVTMRIGEPKPQNQTLILSQAFDPGWTAWERIPTFPYFRQLNDHVLVNNWSNGWTLRSNEIANNEGAIAIFFLPQLLQWLGFFLLPIPFFVAMKRSILSP